jgi:hypothetical protein
MCHQTGEMCHQGKNITHCSEYIYSLLVTLVTLVTHLFGNLEKKMFVCAKNNTVGKKFRSIFFFQKTVFHLSFLSPASFMSKINVLRVTDR